MFSADLATFTEKIKNFNQIRENALENNAGGQEFWETKICPIMCAYQNI